MATMAFSIGTFKIWPRLFIIQRANFRFGIAALTIEGFESKDRQFGPGFYHVGR